jgi:hypothetical protein
MNRLCLVPLKFSRAVPSCPKYFLATNVNTRRKVPSNQKAQARRGAEATEEDPEMAEEHERME